jgi:hypothetical protein
MENILMIPCQRRNISLEVAKFLAKREYLSVLPNGILKHHMYSK